MSSFLLACQGVQTLYSRLSDSGTSSTLSSRNPYRPLLANSIINFGGSSKMDTSPPSNGTKTLPSPAASERRTRLPGYRGFSFELADWPGESPRYEASLARYYIARIWMFDAARLLK